MKQLVQVSLHTPLGTVQQAMWHEQREELPTVSSTVHFHFFRIEATNQKATILYLFTFESTVGYSFVL